MTKRLIYKTCSILHLLSSSRYHEFIRARGFETVGVITKIEQVYDGSWGVMRKWAMGRTVSGDIFEEYLDRKNKRTGELEDLIQMQTDLHIVTARNSSSPDDDDENNFTYLLDANTSNHLKEKLDETIELRRINGALNKKLEEASRLQDSYMRQLETAQSEANSYREKMKNFSQQLGQARARAEYYQTQLKQEQIAMLRGEGELSERMKGATYQGELQGKDSADLIYEGAKKQYMAKNELNKIIGESEHVTHDDLNRLEKTLLSHIDAVKPEKKDNKPKPPTLEELEEDG
jgi:hypothetical protein